MFRMFDSNRWPNNMEFRAAGGVGSTEGLARFSEAEIARRHDLVRAKLKEMDCDVLLAQCHYEPTAMAVSTKIVWLSGRTGYRNAVTLVLPADGELVAIHGRKPSSTPGHLTPYLQGDDITPYVKGVKRIAYVGTGYLSYQFRDFLLEQSPGVEIVDFSNEIAHMMACKSAEEIAMVEDACQIQNRCWQAASAFLRPGRLATDVRNEFWHMMLDLGMDPTLMPKVLLHIEHNRPGRPDDGPHFKDRDYYIKQDDYVTLLFETPGSGGYYAERGRHFFFEEPHPRIVELWDEILKMHEFQMNLYKPGATMQSLRREIDNYKIERGFQPRGELTRSPLDELNAEIRGMGVLTVDRPQIYLEWEDLALAPGMVFCTMPTIVAGHDAMRLFEMAIIDEQGAYSPCPYPLDLTVL